MFLTSEIQEPLPGDLIRIPFVSFEDAIRHLAFDGGIHRSPESMQSLPVFRDGPWAGYQLTRGARMLASIRVGVTLEGRWVIRTENTSRPDTRSFHLYSPSGKFTAFVCHEPPDLRHLPLRIFETSCPVLNLLYQIASEDYLSSPKVATITRRLHAIERALRGVDADSRNAISFHRGFQDGAIQRIQEQIQRVEHDPVCTWKERQEMFRRLREERSLLIRTKARVHGTANRPATFFLKLKASLEDLKAASSRFRVRPWSNALGWLESLILDPVRWFFKIVRGNMGYSVALAIYSPFTFFFITQPMNPHAMRAVGRVRSAYLGAMEEITKFGRSTAPPAPAQPTIDASSPSPGTPAKNPTGFPLSGDDPKGANQTWEERMSHFKAMQIAFEENLEIAPRFGRLEHMETQLNWPVTAESAWLETERFLQLTSFLVSSSRDYDPDFVTWVGREEERAIHVQLYLWDRLTRFILDHPYTLMDESREQTLVNPYNGRAFTLLRTMTHSLSRRFPGLGISANHARIFELSGKFEKTRQHGHGVLDRLWKNSPGFEQDGLPDAQKLRDRMRRQWEVLYLLENRAQEAALSGLQLYVWSVRNAIHLLQSLYSSKRADLSHLALAFKRGATPARLSSNPDFQGAESQFEALLHLLILEFASVQKELSESLPLDVEAAQRTRIIENLRSSFREREQLLRSKERL
jgi:hypothetical protein